MTAIRLLAAVMLAALTFCWGLRVGYEATRPWEITDYSPLNAAQMSWVIEGIEERIYSLNSRLARAVEAQRQKLDAEGIPWRDVIRTTSATAWPSS